MKNVSRVALENNICEMDKLFEFANMKINKKVIDHDLMSCINNFIDYFVEFSRIDIKNLKNLNDKLADCLVKIVDACNFNDGKKICNLFIDEMKNIYYKYKKEIINYIETMRYNLIVFGVNKYSQLTTILINKDIVDIIAYIDLNNENIGKYINNRLIISINQLKNYNYDYILLMDYNYKYINELLRMYSITDDNIINYIKFLNITITSMEFFDSYYKFINNEKNYEGIITGISYTQKSIRAVNFSKKFFNFAGPCQDLYYDYEMLKYALNINELKSSLKYVIIGLSYYSFQYDLSQSIYKNRVWYYYIISNSIHNYKNSEFINFIKDFYKKTNIILNKNHIKIIWEHIINPNYKSFLKKSSQLKPFNSKILDEKDKAKIINGIKKLFNKDYPNTVKENKKIFKDFLELLKINNIKPIIVTSPQTEIYCKYISENIKNEFKNILYEFKQKYNFQVLDYTYSDKFNDNDFYDFSHMNIDGSIKFTKILENDILW